ncbi:MAG: GlsB/YeaQ/YmgE family stress response membrane protein [Actinomycetota bacterium]
MSILGLIVPGLIVGLIARMLVPTGRRYGCLGTILLGIAGSFVGGTLASVLAGDGFDISGAGWIGSVVGAVIVLLVLRSSGSPGGRRG